MVNEAGVLVAETVMILTPYMGCQQVVQRRNRATPGNFILRHLEPLGVLIEHGINDMDKGLVTGKETVAAGEEISFKPPLTGMFTQYFHHPAVRGKMIVFRYCFPQPGFLCHFE